MRSYYSPKNHNDLVRGFWSGSGSGSGREVGRLMKSNLWRWTSHGWKTSAGPDRLDSYVSNLSGSFFFFFYHYLNLRLWMTLMMWKVSSWASSAEAHQSNNMWVIPNFPNGYVPSSEKVGSVVQVYLLAFSRKRKKNKTKLQFMSFSSIQSLSSVLSGHFVHFSQVTLKY